MLNTRDSSDSRRLKYPGLTSVMSTFNTVYTLTNSTAPFIHIWLTAEFALQTARTEKSLIRPSEQLAYGFTFDINSSLMQILLKSSVNKKNKIQHKLQQKQHNVRQYLHYGGNQLVRK